MSLPVQYIIKDSVTVHPFNNSLSGWNHLPLQGQPTRSMRQNYQQTHCSQNPSKAVAWVQSWYEQWGGLSESVCVSIFSRNQYSYVWNLRHSSGNGRRALMEEKSFKTELKMRGSVSLSFAGGWAWKMVWDVLKKAKKKKKIDNIFLSHWGCFSKIFLQSSWKCNTMRKLLI